MAIELLTLRHRFDAALGAVHIHLTFKESKPAMESIYNIYLYLALPGFPWVKKKGVRKTLAREAKAVRQAAVC